MSPPELFGLRGKRVYVAGHNGMAGSALVRRLSGEGCEIVTADRKALDLTDQGQTERWLAANKPDAVFLAAGLVGGIYANDTYPADFIADNLAIGLNVIRGAYRAGVKKLLALGSSCIYPKLAPQPMTEEALLTGPLEPTNEWYAVAKIAAIKLCEAYRKQHGADFVSVMPTNLYGPGDNYHPDNSHVPAALIRRFHKAKEAGAPTVTVWGTGRPRREFLSSDDLADACVFVMKHYSGPASSISAPAAMSRSPSSPKSCATLPAIRARSPTILRAPTARRRSCSTFPNSRRSAGRRRSRCARGWPPPMPISSKVAGAPVPDTVPNPKRGARYYFSTKNLGRRFVNGVLCRMRCNLPSSNESFSCIINRRGRCPVIQLGSKH